MKIANNSYWFIAFVLGSLINMSLFLILPAIGKTKPPAPPQIIELEFLAWQQPVQKKINKPAPKPKKVAKPKPKPKKKIIKPKPKIKPPPVKKQELAEKVIPKKTTPFIKPQEEIDEPAEPAVSNLPAQKNTDLTEEALPTPIPIFQLTQLPRMIHRQTPIYPPEMKQKGKEATVKLEVLLDIKGQIRKITIKKSGGEAFDKAAIEAIKSSTFMPANIKGKPVAVLMKIPVKFRLR